MAVTNRYKVGVSQSEADTIQGPTCGLADATTSGTEETMDCSAFAGMYVKVYCEEDDHYFAFSLPTVTGAVLVTIAATTPTDYVVDRVDKGGPGCFVVVPKEKTLLHYKSVNGSAGVLRVLRA